MYFKERLKLYNLQIYINMFYFLNDILTINAIIKIIESFE